MLAEPRITAFLPTKQPEKSKYFYQKILGLKLVSEDDFALEFQGNMTFLRITIVQEFAPHPFTVLGFKVKDIVKELNSIMQKGVEFENYEHMPQDDLGIWTSPNKAKVAWFKDPDGNLLSLTEYAG